MPDKNKQTLKFGFLFLLFILIFFHGINNYIWIRLNQRPPIDDEATHLFSGLRYFDILSHPSLKMFSSLTSVDWSYPPLIPLVAASFALIFGRSATVFTMTNMIYFSGIFVCLYFIGKKIADKKTGILAACIFSFYPLVFHLSRLFMLEIALCFMVTASIALLLYSNNFQNTFVSIIFGIFLGLGLLTKQSFIIFIIGPLLFYLLSSFSFQGVYPRRKVVQNLFVVFFIAATVASWWYISNLRRCIHFLKWAAFKENIMPYDIAVFSLSSFLFYFDALINNQIFLFFFLIFVFAVYLIFRQKEQNRYLPVLFTWIILPYFIFSFIKNKYLYYTLAYAPAIALLSAYGIMKMKQTFLKRTIVALILIVGILQLFFLSYIKIQPIKLVSWVHYGQTKHFKILELKLSPIEDIISGIRYYPKRGEWQQDILAAQIKKTSGKTVILVGVYCFDPARAAKIGFETKEPLVILDSYAIANRAGWEYLLAAERIPSQAVCLSKYACYGQKYQKKDFIISYVELKKITSVSVSLEDYDLIEDLNMPDKSKIYLYKLKNKAM